MKPIRKQILVKQTEEKTTTESGIILTGSVETGNKPALVVKKGSDVTIDIKEGDTIYLRWKEAFALTFKGEQMALVDEKDVLAVL